jgi:hypothetical protein
VPDDRPIDGVDASAFLLGQRPTTGRDHVIYFGSDAEVMSVKWRTMKVVLRYTESTSGPIIKPQWPLIFDLIDDPGEEWDLMDKRLDCIWVLEPVAQRLGAFDAERGPLSQHQARPGVHRLRMNPEAATLSPRSRFNLQGSVLLRSKLRPPPVMRLRAVGFGHRLASTARW